MEISELKVGSVFLDTNILLYAYTTTKFSSSCETLLELVQNGSIQGYVNSTVIDEFFTRSSLRRSILKNILLQGMQLYISNSIPIC
jgi:hypothetical protein